MVRYESFFPTVDVKDLHHEEVYLKELSLAKAFALKLPTVDYIDICPISGNQRHEVLFEKWGRRYVLCPQTWSLSLSALPDDEIVKLYFNDSDLARYRCSQDYQYILSRLRKDLWASQIEWVEGRVRRYIGMESYRLVDWGPRLIGWTEALKTSLFISEYIINEPLPPVKSIGHAKNADIVILFDVIQRCPNPHSVFESIFTTLNPGGILLLTCRSGSGFDILSLAGESDSIFPLDHICLPSPEGMHLLLKQVGYEILELTTPGLLDVQLVMQAKENISLEQRFQRYLISRSEQVRERMQGFLQQNNLSSHLRVVARKPE